MRSSPGISMYVIPATVQKTTRAISHIEKMFEKAISIVIQKAAVEIHKDAKVAAPVDFGVLRGSVYFDVKNKITYKSPAALDKIRSGAKTTIPFKNAESDKNGLNAFVGSSLDYAFKQDVRTGYLSMAYSKTAPKVKPAIERAIKEEIKKSTLG